MSLHLVAVPIGNTKDITLHGLELLKSAQLIIAEERKPLFQLFRDLGLPRPENFELLNEHCQESDLNKLADLCARQRVALITDAGTPGFCDPGAELVALCRKKGITITSAPGACSLTAFLSLTGKRLKRFQFEGFLPRKTEERQRRISQLAKNKEPVILMDTPYRLNKTLEGLKNLSPKSQLILGCNLTTPEEQIHTGTPAQVLKNIGGKKANFILLLLPRKEL